MVEHHLAKVGAAGSNPVSRFDIEKISKKLLTKSSESDILNRLSRETAKESSKRATKKNKKVLDKDKSF